MDLELRQKFIERGLLYVRNYYSEIGDNWKEVFRTDQKELVESSCRLLDVECEWVAGSQLRTKMRRPATLLHPVTGHPLWFNAAHLWHVSGIGARNLAKWRLSFKEDFPANCYWGDGSPISDEEIRVVRGAFRSEETLVRLGAGEVLVLDNMLFAHGRKPFTGDRALTVAVDRHRSYEEMLGNV
jgi:hypothetical protein